MAKLAGEKKIDLMFLAELFQTFLVRVVAIKLFSRTSIKITAKIMEQSGKFDRCSTWQ